MGFNAIFITLPVYRSDTADIIGATNAVITLQIFLRYIIMSV